jgi:hypothetical protein
MPVIADNPAAVKFFTAGSSTYQLPKAAT